MSGWVLFELQLTSTKPSFVYSAICVKCRKEYKETMASSSWLNFTTPKETTKDDDSTERYCMIINSNLVDACKLFSFGCLAMKDPITFI